MSDIVSVMTNYMKYIFLFVYTHSLFVENQRNKADDES